MIPAMAARLGSGEELHALVARLGIGSDVVFFGSVPLEETVHFYPGADCFVHPSFNETFGLPLLDAMASGCPVVTSNLSCMPEIAGEAAIFVDPHDPASIADGILEAVGPSSRHLRKRGLGRAGQFTWGTTAEAILGVYRAVAGRRRRGLR